MSPGGPEPGGLAEECVACAAVFGRRGLTDPAALSKDGRSCGRELRVQVRVGHRDGRDHSQVLGVARGGSPLSEGVLDGWGPFLQKGPALRGGRGPGSEGFRPVQSIAWT